MPFSWVRVPAGTSPKLRNCVGDDKTRHRYEQCVRGIVESRHCRVESMNWEANGKFIRLYFWWDEPRDRRAVIADLEATHELDLYDVDDVDSFAAELGEEQAG